VPFAFAQREQHLEDERFERQETSRVWRHEHRLVSFRH
jgi:hypothetical protein